jgi:Uma2 family endonuclease
MSVADPLAPPPLRSFADVLRHLGDVAPDRIRWEPHPGTATVADLVAVNDRKDGPACELVEGFLVEKAVGYSESLLAARLIGFLLTWVLPRNLGHVLAPDGSVHLLPGVVRLPDVAFVPWDRLPRGVRPEAPAPAVVPALVVEVLSVSNTPAEMTRKRREYFTAGVRLAWEVDPRARTVAVYTRPDPADAVLAVGQSLDGGAVLPGFALALADLFGELDRHG